MRNLKVKCTAAMMALLVVSAPSAFALQTGVVKVYNAAKGYGFIKDNSNGKEVMVHASALGGIKIKRNDCVSFEVVDGRKGAVAVNVKLIACR